MKINHQSFSKREIKTYCENIMQNENKRDVVVPKAEQKESNIRALLIVGVFVLLFICIIAFEISTKK